MRGELGRGGMGRVYQVEMPVTGKMAALKSLEPEELLVSLMGGMAAVRELFIAEAMMIANLRHPHVLDIWDCHADGPRPFYVMDYYCDNLGVMMGETFRTEDRSRILPVEKAARYTRQTLLGLERLHHAGIIHRDIKPFNLLVTDYDTVKICDFGLSKSRGERFRGPAHLKVGTPYYAAPEQENDPDDVGPPADIHPVGVMLYRMLTGQLPLNNSEPPSRLHPDLDGDWDELLRKALAPRFQDRYPTAVAMIAELDAVLGRWRERMALTCALPPEPVMPDSGSAGGDARRLTPVKVRPAHARRLFGLDDLWRPEIHAAPRLSEPENGVLADAATGLWWERAGSPYPVTWSDALRHVKERNRTRFGGRSDWRPPTVAELISLVGPVPHGGDLCLPARFDRTQRTLWSADRRSHIAAWTVSMDLGFVSWRDMNGYAHARAVAGFPGSMS